MGKPKLGEKHICSNCDARFFDLGKTPAVCPKCDTEAVIEKPKKKKSKKAKAEEAAEAAALAAEETETKTNAATSDDDEDEDDINDVEVDDDDDDDEDEDKGLMEDASALTGDDDLDGVVGHVKDED